MKRHLVVWLRARDLPLYHGNVNHSFWRHGHADRDDPVEKQETEESGSILKQTIRLTFLNTLSHQNFFCTWLIRCRLRMCSKACSLLASRRAPVTSFSRPRQGSSWEADLAFLPSIIMQRTGSTDEMDVAPESSERQRQQHFHIKHRLEIRFIICCLCPVLTSDRDTVGLIDDHQVFVLVQHAFVEVFGQHVGVNSLQLLTELLQLRHTPLLRGHRGLLSLGLGPLLPDLPGQINGSQPGFLSRVGAWCVFGGGGLTPDPGRCCLRTPTALAREEDVEAEAPVASTRRSPTDIHCYAEWRSCCQAKQPQTEETRCGHY